MIFFRKTLVKSKSRNTPSGPGCENGHRTVREQSENGQSILWPFSQPGPLGTVESSGLEVLFTRLRLWNIYQNYELHSETSLVKTTRIFIMLILLLKMYIWIHINSISLKLCKNNSRQDARSLRFLWILPCFLFHFRWAVPTTPSSHWVCGKVAWWWLLLKSQNAEAYLHSEKRKGARLCRQ